VFVRQVQILGDALLGGDRVQERAIRQDSQVGRQRADRRLEQFSQRSAIDAARALAVTTDIVPA
jgi:hypothetical protein